MNKYLFRFVKNYVHIIGQRNGILILNLNMHILIQVNGLDMIHFEVWH